ncbi:Na+/H+ antiporter subunit G [Halodurantibacterium flavum]|uniref:Na+/H+ antiporter subunit G n=1 Tax=Halodurantibacterium flavum TaxID=1382802 RepID=A0ABW4S1P5_9RHOB
MTLIAEILISVLLVISGVFGLVGSFGLIKLPDPMTRLHAPTKATTLGVGGVLVASMIYFAVFGGGFSFHELMITIFLFITAPIVAHFIAKAWVHRNLTPAELPPTGGPKGWACKEDAAEADKTPQRPQG